MSLIPIFLGVTGHRDLPIEDYSILEASVGKQLRDMKARYPHSPLCVLTSLAEGADRIAARVASREGIEFAVVLPMDESDYERDFTKPESKIDFSELIHKAQTVFRPYLSAMPRNRDDSYLVAGKFIALTAQIVIAVWDGNASSLEDAANATPPKGGTADVVRMCRQGLRSPSVLALPEPTALIHIQARRTGQVRKHETAEIGKIVPTSHVADLDAAKKVNGVLDAVERFNSRASRLSEAPGAGTDPISGTFDRADSLARSIQKERKTGIRLVTLFASFAVIAHQVFSGISMQAFWLVGHFLLVLAAVWIYRSYFRGNNRRDIRYLDFRALAEGLRVQLFWRMAGMPFHVADHYFSEDADELEWLRHAVRNITLIGEIHVPLKDAGYVERKWLVEQRDYFRSRVPYNSKRDDMVKIFARCLVAFAITVTAMALPIQVLWAAGDLINWLMFSAALMFLAAGAARAYSDVMGFGELARRYSVMSRIFELAQLRFEEAATGTEISTLQREILFAAGREALAENCAWLRSHRAREIELPIGA